MPASKHRKLNAGTQKERMQRARALAALEKLRKARGTVGTRQFAFGGVLEKAKKAHGIEGKPFARMPEANAIKYLDRRLLPSRAVRLRVSALLRLRQIGREKVSARKEAIVKQLFGTGALGLIMIKPEMFARSREIRKFLRTNGFDIAFKKSFVFAKEDIARLYPHIFEDRQAYGRFAAQIFSLLSTPSLVVVFRQQPNANYERFARGQNLPIEQFARLAPQDAFAASFKTFLRKYFTWSEFKAADFERGILSDSTRVFDALGFFEKSAQDRKNPTVVINGIHVPTSTEIARDARTLLTLAELEKLEKRTKSRLKG